MGKGGKKQTVTTAPDPATAAYVQQVRNMALNGGQAFPVGYPARREPPGLMGMDPSHLASQFMNPYQSQVIDATRGEFDHLRDQASMDANQAATLAGAFGGSRHGVMEGTRFGELDRAQASTIANLLNTGYNNALQFGQNRQQMGINLLNLGMGMPGQTSVQQGGGPSRLGQAAGGAMTGASIGSIIPGIGTGIGAAIGGGLGLLGIL